MVGKQTIPCCLSMASIETLGAGNESFCMAPKWMPECSIARYPMSRVAVIGTRAIICLLSSHVKFRRPISPLPRLAWSRRVLRRGLFLRRALQRRFEACGIGVSLSRRPFWEQSDSSDQAICDALLDTSDTTSSYVCS